MPALALEIATYDHHLPHLLAESPERYVLIKGERIEGVFPDRDEALMRGYMMFPDDDFLVRKIQAHQPAHNVPLIFGHG
ncbi:hypothetical protein [Methylobacterium radiotolerans]|uniref:hypothetical protein n=1 Tax=Methylobacterium radiotolerans TaxID=31998 RepID=UPI001F2DD63B|nr:hypothetical protein [Methylobacterium radiotolerans]UIY45799.1 hypothetical protein LZ599_32100 [Methylobacterium radiotolerans]